MRYIAICMLCIFCTSCRTVARVAVSEFEREVVRVVEEQIGSLVVDLVTEKAFSPLGFAVGGILFTVLGIKGGHILGKNKKEKND